MKSCLYTFWAPGPERSPSSTEPRSCAACSSRVRPAEGANVSSARGGRQPSGQLLNPVGSDTSWAVTECPDRVPGVLSDVWIYHEGPPEIWEQTWRMRKTWEDEAWRKEALDRSCPTDKRVRGFKIWQGSCKQIGVSFDHSQTLYWQNPTPKHHHPAVLAGREGSVSPCFHCVRSGWRKPRYLILRKKGRSIQGQGPSVSLALSPGPTCVSRESWILGKILERISNCWLRTKPVTSNDPFPKWETGGGSSNICPHAYILGFLVFMSWKL